MQKNTPLVKYQKNKLKKNIFELIKYNFSIGRFLMKLKKTMIKKK